MNWYAIRYDFQLFSNFTYSLDRTQDQFAQTDSRTVVGGTLTRSWLVDVGALSLVNTLGLQVRQDRAKLGLDDSVARQLQTVVRDDRVQVTAVGLYGESEVGWTSWLRSVTGVRVDHHDARVNSVLNASNTGEARAAQASPKFSVILGPWHNTEWFINAGKGFHSNDARGATARMDPRTGASVDAVPALVSTRGRELGLKAQWVPGLLTALSVWRLDMNSELVYLGDAGTTQAGRPARRDGVEWSNHWMPGRRVALTANLAWTRPRYSDALAAGPYIPNAVQQVSNMVLSAKNLGPWSGSVGVRYVGPAPLTENNTVRSASSLTTNVRVSRQLNQAVEVSLDVLNSADRHNNDISYWYTSRVSGESTGVKDVHGHPAEPRSLRLTTRMNF